MKRTTIGLVSALLLAGCLGHQMDLVTSWRDPAATSAHFNRVIAIFITKDSALRRVAEDRFAADVPGAIPSYTVIPDSAVTDASKVRELVSRQDVDGAVIIRIVTVDQQFPYVSGKNTPYASPYDLWGSWGTSWSVAYDPQYTPAIRAVAAEGGVYSVSGNRLVWAGHSPSLSTATLAKMMSEIVDAMVAAMKQENLL